MPDKLWVKHGEADSVDVATFGCEKVSDFKAPVMSALALTGSAGNVRLFTRENDSPARPGHSLKEAFYGPKTKAWFGINDLYPLIVKTIPLAAPPVTQGRLPFPFPPFQAGRQKNVIAVGAKKFPAPSSFATSKGENSWVVVLRQDIEGKPTCRRLENEVVRPRLTILCKEFFDFSMNIDSIKHGTKDCLFAREVCRLMGCDYDNEEARMEAFRTAFEEYSGHHFQRMELFGSFKTDGSIRTGRLPLYCNLEGKIERGKGNSDPFMQNIAFYWKSFEDLYLENLQYPCYP